MTLIGMILQVLHQTPLQQHILNSPNSQVAAKPTSACDSLGCHSYCKPLRHPRMGAATPPAYQQSRYDSRQLTAESPYYCHFLNLVSHQPDYFKCIVLIYPLTSHPKFNINAGISL